MCWKWLKPISDTNQADLTKCNADKVTLTGQLADTEALLAACTTEKKDLQYKFDALTALHNDYVKFAKLLTEGPEIPDQSKVKWLQASYIEAVLTDALGAPFANLPLEKRFWSDSDFLVCPADQIQLFLDYYTMFWLPNINPYTILKWTKLNGENVDIWAVDCDDFADFLQGLPTINSKWACFPWGTMWGVVGGSMNGGHAFNWIVCCDDDYKEESPSVTPTKGLKLYLIEPQMGQQWPKETPSGTVVRAEITGYKLKEVKGFFDITEVWLCKV